MAEDLMVRRIEKGTVLDHLPAGSALSIMNLLKLEDNLVVVAVNVLSSRYGTKDMIKIEGKLLSKAESDKIGLIAPNATINIIRGGRVMSKGRASPPEEIKGILRCPNKKCITNFEQCETKFIRTGDKYKCVFCESHFSVRDFELQPS